MKYFAISGTSGVGKTFLEEILGKEYNFANFPKYTNRPQTRLNESTNLVRFLSDDEMSKNWNDFLFTLEYMGYKYGWRNDEFEKIKNSNVAIGITLESLKDLVVRLPDFIPILMYVDIGNFALIEKRMKERENFSNQNPDEQNITIEQINKRLALARDEFEKINEYKNIVDNAGGRSFEIKSDETIYKDVIPFILSKIH